MLKERNCYTAGNIDSIRLMNWHKIAVDKFDKMIYNPVILTGCNEILESQRFCHVMIRQL